MNDEVKNAPRASARLPRGLADRGPAEIAATERMLAEIREVYELYGFEPVETPCIEFTDALGKFLPDLDRPNEGVFSFRDDDVAGDLSQQRDREGSWLSLRYDLTAPLARYVAENFDKSAEALSQLSRGLCVPQREAGAGAVPPVHAVRRRYGGARLSVAADAEMCMMAADTMERARHSARRLCHQGE